MEGQTGIKFLLFLQAALLFIETSPMEMKPGLADSAALGPTLWGRKTVI